MKDKAVTSDLTVEESQLICAAYAARKNAYTPYSHFAVGAALRTKSGKLYTGCNLESAAYSPTLCAERTALAKAVSEGERQFSAICIVGGQAGLEPPTPVCSPCGVCRQLLREFVNPTEFEVLLATDETHAVRLTLEQLLPMSFGPDMLGFDPDEKRI